jgi:hypothetical protein
MFNKRLLLYICDEKSMAKRPLADIFWSCNFNFIITITSTYNFECRMPMFASIEGLA